MFVDEAGLYLLPGLVRTYSPAGLTPVLYEWQSRDHLSLMAGLTRRGRLSLLVREEALGGADSAAFLGRLARRGRWLIVWDGAPIHRCGPVRELLASRPWGRRLWLERLPGYAPELNPVEGLWQQLKHVELRNVVCVDLRQLREELRLAVARLRHKGRLAASFFEGAGLA
jgi:transposase